MSEENGMHYETPTLTRVGSFEEITQAKTHIPISVDREKGYHVNPGDALFS